MPSSTSENRIPKEAWKNKQVHGKEGKVTVQIKGFTEATGSRKVVAGDGGEASVFVHALEGLSALKEQFPIRISSLRLVL